MGLINYEEVENGIIELENILEKYDYIERRFLLQQCLGRMAEKIQKKKVAETINGNPLVKFATKFVKNDTKEEL